jgi:hypothetical protein
MVTSSFLGTYAKQQEEGYNSTMTKYFVLVDYQKDDVSMTNP